MARKYEIGVGIDTGGFERGVANGIVDPLEDAADALDDLERAANSADLDKQIDKAAKATEELDDELDDARDALRRLGYSARDAGDDARRGMDDAGEGVENLKDEAKQSARETAASFSEVTDVLDLIQELAANALVGFGPGGIAAGLLAAAGIGLATSAFQAAEEAAEDLRQKAVEYAGDATEAGVATDTWLTGAAQIVERIRELEQLKSTDFRFFWDEDPSQLEEWADALDKMGRPASEIGDVLKSSTDAVKDYRDAIKESRRATQDEIDEIFKRTDAQGESTQADRDRMEVLREELAGSKDLLESLDSEIKLRDSASDSAARQSAAGVDAALQRAQAEEEAANAVTSALESVEQSALGAYDSMRSAAYDKATADDAAFDTDKWLAYVEETRALADGYKTNLASMKLTPAEWENFLALPEDARNSIAASYSSAGEDGKERIRKALSDSGSTAGADATVGFEESFNPEANVEVTADTSGAAADLDEVTEDRDVDIKANLTGEAAVRDGLETLTKRRTVAVEAVLDTSQATRDLAAWRRSEASKTVTITAKLAKGEGWDK
ncbi:hypothetical protein [Microbacterium sp. GCS4]|uniref:hypothetical protein n=1 Tax=Microbacterium sp. GCS4 TaxID=1692239 RepID=UPI000682D314|nr:hypothetical protein [Microbacterium sp. GCS4]KNY07916.1 hypothetical protein AKH00_06780 [Microbacterium sp. GCS4]